MFQAYPSSNINNSQKRAIKRAKQRAKRKLRLQKRNKSVPKVKTAVPHNNNRTGIISEQQQQNGWTNEALLDALSFWNIPTQQQQQQYGVGASPNKNMEMIIPQNCRVIQLSLHEILPMGS